MVFKALRLLVILLLMTVISFTKAKRHTKEAVFSAAKPHEASASRIFLKSFSLPSELSCSQKCLHNEQCNFKKYNHDTKQCELLCQINKNDFKGNAIVTKKGHLCHTRHSLCKPIQCGGCGENCKCENATGQHTCNCIEKGVFPSCKAALESNGFQTAIYRILPANFKKPINVECMKDANGISFAVLHHNHERATIVHGYEDWGSYKFNFTYSLDMGVIIPLIYQSSYCQQFTKAQCYNAFFYRSIYDWNTWINGRHGQKLDFWGGGPSNGTGCACGVSKTCDGGPDYRCNCDMNDSVWRSDEGYVVKKEVLPITSIATGDTGDDVEKLIYTIGPLLCVI